MESEQKSPSHVCNDSFSIDETNSNSVLENREYIPWEIIVSSRLPGLFYDRFVPLVINPRVLLINGHRKNRDFNFGFLAI